MISNSIVGFDINNWEEINPPNRLFFYLIMILSSNSTIHQKYGFDIIFKMRFSVLNHNFFIIITSLIQWYCCVGSIIYINQFGENSINLQFSEKKYGFA